MWGYFDTYSNCVQVQSESMQSYETQNGGRIPQKPYSTLLTPMQLMFCKLKPVNMDIKTFCCLSKYYAKISSSEAYDTKKH